MMNWLVGNSQVFGLTVENWMLLIGGGLLLYFMVLAVARRCRQSVR
jgi:hypothetical protein